MPPGVTPPDQNPAADERRGVSDMRTRFLLVTLVAALLTFGPTPTQARADVDAAVVRLPGDVAARGAFTCDFALGPEAFTGNLPAVIERDRMYMAARPGMLQKHIPIRLDAAAAAQGGVAFSGGRYLFDTAERARDYADFVTREFVLDGVQFLSRSYFLAPDCHPWAVVAAAQWAGPERQVLMRTERFSVPAGSDTKAVLRERWPALRAEARARGYSAVWLLHQPDESLVSVVSYTERLTPDAPLAPDVAGLAALETAAPLGAVFADQGWVRVLDRTSWTLTTWFPFAAGDHGPPSLWHYSAFPSPERPVADGLCEPSRGENGIDDPEECRPHCGDAVAQPDEGETTATCPSDVRLDKHH